VRLAAKLLGWKIDIKSEEEKRQEVEQQMESLTSQQSTPLEKVTDLGEALIGKLNEAGISTVEALADMTPEQLEEVPGVGPKTVEKISIAVNNYFSSLEASAGAATPEAAETATVESAEAGEPTAEATAGEAPAPENADAAATTGEAEAGAAEVNTRGEEEPAAEGTVEAEPSEQKEESEEEPS
jgi:N utilization substance protein A